MPSSFFLANQRAKKFINDEFYTQLKDIAAELSHYTIPKDTFIYCPCDSEQSNFVKYFADNEYTNVLYTADDFRNHADIFAKRPLVITNPPFSELKTFIPLLFEYKCPFIIVGNLSCIQYIDILPYLIEEKLLPGFTTISKFIAPTGESKHIGYAQWMFSLPHPIYHPFIPLVDKPITEYSYYDANDWKGNVIPPNSVPNIPKSNLIPEYDGIMGVPLSFFSKWNPQQFDIIGVAHKGNSSLDLFKAYIDGKQCFTKLLIRRKNNEQS